METGIRLLLLSALLLTCSGCVTMHFPWHHPKPEDSPTVAANVDPNAPVESSARSDDGGPPPAVVEPQVERRSITVPHVHARNLELGGYYGELSIADFGAQPVAGARLDYHITEDFFFEATYGRAKAGKTSFEELSGNVQLLSEAERRFTYYNVSLGYNLLPGEVFIGHDLAMTSALYAIGGIGEVTFAGDENFAVNFGAGFRVLPTDWLAIHIDVQDIVFRSDDIGNAQLKNNLQATIGATVFFW
jgi:outer membrane beta-barrel protein